MAYTDIVYEVSDWIATITLNRPDKLNAWTFPMEQEYRDAMADAEARDDVRVIILTGAGRGFCAGADMSLLTSVQQGSVDASDMEMKEHAFGAGKQTPDDFQKQYSFPAAIRKPVIAAINGHAMGLGLVNALYCDFRFASVKAKFGTAFVQRGLIAEWGMAWTLPRAVGFENAMDLLMSGRIIEAEEAKAMGMVSRVFPADTLIAKTREYATHLATMCSPRSLGVIKRQLWDAQITGLETASDVSYAEMLESFGSQDFVEGVSSFLEKRAPNFPGK